MNNKLKNIGEKVRVLSSIPENENFGSVIAVLMIISIILTLVRVLQECNKSKLSILSTSQDKYSLYGTEIKSYSIKKGWFTKLRIKRLIKLKMSKEQYAKYGIPLLSAILDTGENLNDDEVVTLVEAANV